MGIKSETLQNLSNLIESNSLPAKENEFYNTMLINLQKEVYSSYSGIYFLDDTSLCKKASHPSSDTLFDTEKQAALLKFLTSVDSKTFCLTCAEISPYLYKDSAFCGCFFLFSKLMIKNSFFGFVVLAKNTPFTQDEISILNLSVSIHSYLIKDFELNKVFKTQLSLLQDAIEDKENALKLVEKQNKKLIEADSVKTNFLANVSHELRTPLSAILGFSDVLLNKVFGELNPKQTEYIRDINLSALHLMELINTLLDFSKIESGSIKLTLSEFDPKSAVDEVLMLIKPLLEAKEIELIYQNSASSILKADYQKFKQILLNLVGNAIKFSKQKGKIVVRTTDDGEYFILEVQDFGIGIEKKYHNFIFKKFTQIDNIYTKKGTSTGLGLAITKELVKLHKGKIYVTSEPGEGSTFVVKLSRKLKQAF